MTVVVNVQLMLPEIDMFKQHYVCKWHLVYLTQ